MKQEKGRHRKENERYSKGVASFIILFLVIMAVIIWFFMPEFKAVVKSDFSIFDIKLMQIYMPKPSPTVIVEQQDKDIGDAIATVMPSPTPIDGYITTENSYKSDNVEVKIERISKNDLTYYVADVKRSDISRKTASEISNKNDAIVAINTDFYSYKNRGLIIRNGEVLLNNGFRDIFCIFDDGKVDCFAPNQFTPQQLLDMGVVETFDFGPIMVYDGKITDDSIGGITQKTSKHPRTGIGYYSEGHYLFIVADGRKEGYSLGINIEDFAKIFEAYGVKIAYNLDGGGSTTMTFLGDLVNLPEGNDKQRSIDSILYVYDDKYSYNEK